MPYDVNQSQIFKGNPTSLLDKPKLTYKPKLNPRQVPGPVVYQDKIVYEEKLVYEIQEKEVIVEVPVEKVLNPRLLDPKRKF